MRKLRSASMLLGPLVAIVVLLVFPPWMQVDPHLANSTGDRRVPRGHAFVLAPPKAEVSTDPRDYNPRASIPAQVDWQELVHELEISSVVMLLVARRALAPPSGRSLLGYDPFSRRTLRVAALLALVVPVPEIGEIAFQKTHYLLECPHGSCGWMEMLVLWALVTPVMYCVVATAYLIAGWIASRRASTLPLGVALVLASLLAPSALRAQRSSALAVVHRAASLAPSLNGGDCANDAPSGCDRPNTTGRNVALGVGIGGFIGALSGLSSDR